MSAHVVAVMPRFDIIDAEIAWAEAEAAKGEMSAWKQQLWATNDAPCGTAYCIAGHVTAQYVGIQLKSSISYGHVDTWLDPVGFDSYEGASDSVLHIGYEELLGPAPSWSEDPVGYDAYWDRVEELNLYNSENTLDDLKRIRDNIAEHVGHPTRWR